MSSGRGASSDPIVLDGDVRPSGKAVARRSHTVRRSTAEEEAHFSDGEEEQLPAPAADGALAGAGYDFSGTVCAYAGQPLCICCGEALQPVWDAERQELVVEDAYLIRFQIYHAACVRRQRVS